MTIEKASEIVRIFGVYLEYVAAINLMVFSNKTPESILPFPKSTILEALNLIADHHRRNGNQQAVKSLEFSVAGLEMYVDDEDALLQAAKNWGDPLWRKTQLPVLKKHPETWIKSQNQLNRIA